jgi:general secretion pathway protein K
MTAIARQRGVALITAIILVAIAAVLATAIGYASAMSARRASTLFGSNQAFLAAEGAEAMAAYVLRNTQAPFSLSQHWAQAYGPFELTDGVTLEYAQLEDEQSKFNVNNLAPVTGPDNPNALQAFTQLLQLIGLEPKWAPILADWINNNPNPTTSDGAGDSVYLSQAPPYRKASTAITSISELMALPGFGRARYDRLAPYITALPPGTNINVCTASGPVLDAIAGKTEYSNDAAAFANERQLNNGCFPSLQVFTSTLAGDPSAAQLASTLVSNTTQYFRLRTVITIGTARFTLYSLLFVDQSHLARPILRTFGTE